MPTKHPQTTNTDLPGFNIEQTPTESSAVGALIHISQNLSYKRWKDLQIYYPNELESTFIKVLILTKKSHLIGVVYKHPSKHNSNCVLGNITTYISDHLPQFLIIENLMQPSFKQHPPISFRDYKNFNKEAFKTELCDLIGHLLQRIMI